MKSAIVTSRVKLSMNVGKAVPGPKIASVLGPRGIAIPKFCEAFNKMTGDSNKYKIGDSIAVRVIVYDNKSYDLFVNNAPAVSDLLKQATCLAKGTSDPGKKIVSKIDKSVLTDIAKRKMSDMKINKLKSALKMVLGTARSMGIEIEGLEED
ncbi:MAG: 50S ribosomal protein L11 [Candidatus Mesenet longicola]|uniref:Large ribosomal subunit protein uL11 n=1 Tax=Candidatus Mesenet longicola TaxID=1892558 RepID=A0A8J3HUJ1_9RICK|nr:MAG: 50S ribosomal protein L11 [Candidatus Mesenet longicola]GHM59279.1 MAG: 50S ribosomal protein L11 [Candidatus Mesenet longicola]